MGVRVRDGQGRVVRLNLAACGASASCVLDGWEGRSVSWTEAAMARWSRAHI